ncbi:MYND Zn-finger protein [Ceratobasidium sp. AG-Ba]|nr:MYND Zn-finger protein [Ceratobasidium sp. AG-Ba]
MSHPLHWSGKSHFYPIGNTPPVCLTQDLSPDQSADILLLGCGDPHHILFTLYADLVSSSTPRLINFTCCDLEPAVLARNVILFTLIEDGESIDQAWSIFYHFQIDDSALDLLVRQSQKLIRASNTPQAWRSSRYGLFLKFLDTRTLNDLRRHWELYAGYPKLPKATLKQIRDQKKNVCEPVLKSGNILNVAALVASRSAGPLLPKALPPVSKELYNYWKTGTMFQRPFDVNRAKHLNPTFVYSLSGETFNVHYGTFPQGFHFAPIFAPLLPGQPGWKMKDQFKAWTKSFQRSRKAGAVTIWLYAGDALAFCHAFSRYSTSGETASTIRVKQWSGAQVEFDQLAADLHIPKSYDVIDSSNLADHLGILNILIAAPPLLKSNPSSQSVLYTETLLLAAKRTNKSLHTRLRTDIMSIGFLLGLVPRPYLTGFTTQSHAHETMIMPEFHGNYRERIAWVHPASGDRHFQRATSYLAMRPKDLVKLLLNFYLAVCPDKKLSMLSFFSRSPILVQNQDIHNYHSETFVKMFQQLPRRVLILDGSWTQLTNQFLDLAHKPSYMASKRDTQELALQMFRQATEIDIGWKTEGEGDTVQDFYFKNLQLSAIEAGATCLVVTIPRSNLRSMLDNPKLVGTVLMQCRLIYGQRFATYDSVLAIWGRCITDKNGRFIIQEDAAGQNGTSGLVVTCWVSSVNLDHKEVRVSFGFWPTPVARVASFEKLGPSLDLFSSEVHLNRSVPVLPYQPALVGQSQQTWLTETGSYNVSKRANDRFTQAIIKSFWTKPSQVTALVAVTPAKSKNSKRSIQPTSSRQISPCAIKLSDSSKHCYVTYPYPIQGGSHEFHKKFQRQEIKAPLSRTFGSGGYKLDPFPILPGVNGPYLWNIHYVNLDRMPLIDTRNPQDLGWLSTHIHLQKSESEQDEERKGFNRASIWIVLKNMLDFKRKNRTQDTVTELKRSISQILAKYSGLVGSSKRVFLLQNNARPFAWLLVGGLRLDLTSASVVLDAAVIYSTNEADPKFRSGIAKIAKHSEVVPTSTTEARAWKHLLPALSERCRTWTHAPGCTFASLLHLDPQDAPDEEAICGCGTGKAFNSTIWEVPEWKPILPFATRVALSPLFSVPYLEKTASIKNIPTSIQNKIVTYTTEVRLDIKHPT